MNARSTTRAQRRGRLIAIAAISLSLVPYADSQGDMQKLMPPPGTPGGQCGWSVAVSGNAAIFGAPLDDEAGANAGAVYFSRYDDVAEAWGDLEKILPPPGSDGDRFGWSVAMYGNVALIGADRDDDSGTNAGAAYFYRYNDGLQTWSFEQKVAPPAGADGDQFGQAVALSGDAAIIGAPSDDDGGSNAGAAYFYRYDAGMGTWGSVQKVVPGTAFGLVGVSVAIEGEAAVIGAPGDTEVGIDAGAAYFYRYDPQTQTWGSPQKQFGPGPDPRDGFETGDAVALSGAWALIGAPGDDQDGVRAGRAYAYHFNDGSQLWEYRREISAGSDADSFGTSIAMSGTVAIIGSPGDDDSGSQAGAAYEFRFDSAWAHWLEASKIVPSPPADGDSMGTAVALQGATALVAAFGDDDGGNQAGAVYAAPIVPAAPIPETEWAAVAGGAANDFGLGIAVDSAGNGYVTGFFQGAVTFDPFGDPISLFSAGGTDMFLARYDIAGDVEWVVRAGGLLDDYGQAIAVSPGGASYVTGEFEGLATFGVGEAAVTLTSAGEEDIFVAKYGPAGDLMWAVNAGGAGQDAGIGLALDDAGNVFVTGTFDQSADFGTPDSPNVVFTAGFNDAYLAKYDASGTLQWVVAAGGAASDLGFACAVDGAGNAHVTGRYFGTATFGSAGSAVTLTSVGSIDMFVAKYNPSGDLAWAVSAGGTESEEGYGIAADETGHVSVTGNFGGLATFGEGASAVTLTSAGSQDVFVARYDVDGNLAWATRGGGSSADYGYDVAVDGAGNIYVTGAIIDFAVFEGSGGETFGILGFDSFDMFAAKYGPTGALAWLYKSAGLGIEFGRGIAVDELGSCRVAGHFDGRACFGMGCYADAGAFDIFIWTSEASEVACPADLDGDGSIGFGDLLQVLSNWGACGGSCPEDLDLDGMVAFQDLLIVLSGWGPC